MSIRYSDELRRGRFGHIPGTGGGGTHVPPDEGGGGGGTSILLDDFSSVRLSNNGGNDYFMPYNNAVGDAGPNQTSPGVSSNRFVVSASAADVFYVNALSPPYSSSTDWMHQHIESGVWDNGVNRMVTGFLATAATSSNFSPSDNFNCGTYIKELNDFTPSYQGNHYYHGCGHPISSNRAIKVFITNRPDHEVGESNLNTNYSPQANYFTRMTRFYFTHWGPYYDTDPDGQNGASTYYLYPVYLYNQDAIVQEDDQWIGTTLLSYDGAKYVLSFAAQPANATVFDIRYTTDGQSVRTKGFANATSGGTVTAPGDSYSSCTWSSPNMSESSSGFYVAARRSGQTTLYTQWYFPFNFSATNMGVP